ncbi:hypothetical protein WEU32_01365 [Brevundimonas sp. BH3]|uniref:hypothetical protein n=1 Tax=Brevundimonas sp. BH3 TaxID=3133089 RepID=UPI0032565735
MAYPISRLWLAAALVVPLAACNPANPPSDPAPPSVAPPTTAPAASEAMPRAAQPANPSLSPEGQPLEQPLSCLDERGRQQADNLVQRCLAVTPATRPPCNVQNPCAMIENEIKRSCDMYGPTEIKPTECAA